MDPLFLVPNNTPSQEELETIWGAPPERFDLEPGEGPEKRKAGTADATRACKSGGWIGACFVDDVMYQGDIDGKLLKEA